MTCQSKSVNSASLLSVAVLTKSCQRHLLLVICLLSVTGCSSGKGSTSAQSSDELELKRLENEYVAVHDATGIPFLERVLAKDFTFVNSRGALQTRQEMLNYLKDGDLSYDRIHLDELLIRLYGDTGLTTGKVSIRAHYKGELLEYSVRFTRTWLKIDKQWHVVAHQASRIQSGP